MVGLECERRSVFFDSPDALYQHFLYKGVHPRLYFYPLLTDLPMYRSSPAADPFGGPHAWRAKEVVLYLPLYSCPSDQICVTDVNFAPCA